jgi:hypothetical protein
MATVIAYGTNRQAYFDLFMASCHRHRIEPVLLGWGRPWVGFGQKTIETRDYLRALPEHEVVISVDPFDVVFLSGLDEIEAKFRRVEAPFLCGALSLGPFLRWVYRREFNLTHQRTPHNRSGYDYLNSGTWISTAGYARRLIDHLVRDHGMRPTDMDQEILTGIYVRDRSLVDIDWRCEIFHNLLFTSFITRTADLKHLEWRAGRAVNRHTGAEPCILHASGNARMAGIAKSLGYPAEQAVPVASNRNYLRKAAFHIGQLLAGRRGARARAPTAPRPPRLREPSDDQLPEVLALSARERFDVRR